MASQPGDAGGRPSAAGARYVVVAPGASGRRADGRCAACGGAPTAIGAAACRHAPARNGRLLPASAIRLP